MNMKDELEEKEKAKEDEIIEFEETALLSSVKFRDTYKTTFKTNSLKINSFDDIFDLKDHFIDFDPSKLSKAFQFLGNKVKESQEYSIKSSEQFKAGIKSLDAFQERYLALENELDQIHSSLEHLHHRTDMNIKGKLIEELEGIPNLVSIITSIPILSNIVDDLSQRIYSLEDKAMRNDKRIEINFKASEKFKTDISIADAKFTKLNNENTELSKKVELIDDKLMFYVTQDSFDRQKKDIWQKMLDLSKDVESKSKTDNRNKIRDEIEAIDANKFVKEESYYNKNIELETSINTLYNAFDEFKENLINGPLIKNAVIEHISKFSVQNLEYINFKTAISEKVEIISNRQGDSRSFEQKTTDSLDELIRFMNNSRLEKNEVESMKSKVNMLYEKFKNGKITNKTSRASHHDEDLVIEEKLEKKKYRRYSVHDNQEISDTEYKAKKARNSASVNFSINDKRLDKDKIHKLDSIMKNDSTDSLTVMMKHIKHQEEKDEYKKKDAINYLTPEGGNEQGNDLVDQDKMVDVEIVEADINGHNEERMTTEEVRMEKLKLEELEMQISASYQIGFEEEKTEDLLPRPRSNSVDQQAQDSKKESEQRDQQRRRSSISEMNQILIPAPIHLKDKNNISRKSVKMDKKTGRKIRYNNLPPRDEDGEEESEEGDSSDESEDEFIIRLNTLETNYYKSINYLTKEVDTLRTENTNFNKKIHMLDNNINGMLRGQTDRLMAEVNQIRLDIEVEMDKNFKSSVYEANNVVRKMKHEYDEKIHDLDNKLVKIKYDINNFTQSSVMISFSKNVEKIKQEIEQMQSLITKLATIEDLKNVKYHVRQIENTVNNDNPMMSKKRLDVCASCYQEIDFPKHNLNHSHQTNHQSYPINISKSERSQNTGIKSKRMSIEIQKPSAETECDPQMQATYSSHKPILPTLSKANRFNHTSAMKFFEGENQKYLDTQFMDKVKRYKAKDKSKDRDRMNRSVDVYKKSESFYSNKESMKIEPKYSYSKEYNEIHKIKDPARMRRLM